MLKQIGSNSFNCSHNGDLSFLTFLIVSSMDLPPFQGLVDFLMQFRLAMLCHFLSSSFLWKALASMSTLSYRYRLETCKQ